MLWGMMIIFAILAVILLAGKGSFLIAGYNTASKEKKACYDEKKLCRVVGGCMGIATVCLGIMAYYEKNMYIKRMGIFFTGATMSGKT